MLSDYKENCINSIIIKINKHYTMNKSSIIIKI